MSLVYNNDKPIGKCESYSIDKVPGTSPFVMLTNYEPLRSELNENQQVVLEWLKEDGDPNITVMLWQLTDNVLESQSMSVDIGEHVTAWKSLTDKQQFEVLAAYAEWGMKEVAE